MYSGSRAKQSKVTRWERTTGRALVDALRDGRVSEEDVRQIEVPVRNAGESDAVAIGAHVLLERRNAVGNGCAHEACTKYSIQVDDTR